MKKALGPREKRAAIDFLINECRLSIQRACKAVGFSRLALFRPLVDWQQRDGEVIDALSGLAEKKPGLDFWKLYDR